MGFIENIKEGYKVSIKMKQSQSYDSIFQVTAKLLPTGIFKPFNPTINIFSPSPYQYKYLCSVVLTCAFEILIGGSPSISILGSAPFRFNPNTFIVSITQPLSKANLPSWTSNQTFTAPSKKLFRYIFTPIL